MRESLEKFKVAATGRWAISIRTYMLAVPFAVLIGLERENILNPGNSTRSFAIVMCGELASYLYIFIAQATLLRHRRVRLQSLSLCIFIWFSTGTVKGLFFIIYAVWAYGYEPDFLARLIPPTLFAGFSSALLAFYFGSIERRRIESKALGSLDELLSVDQGLMMSADAHARGEAMAALKSTLIPQLEKLQRTLSTLAESDFRNQDKLTSLAQQSEQLSAAVNFQAQAIARSRANIHRKRPRKDSISYFSGLFPQVISVRITMLVVILGASTGQMTRNGPQGVASGLVGAAVLGVVVLVLRQYSKRLTGAKLRNLLIACYPIVFLTQAIYVANLSRIGFNLRDPYMPWYSGMKTIYGFYIASIIASLLVDTTQHFDNSRTESEVLRRELARLDRGQEVLRQHIFTTRFGSVQGKISGVVMALQLSVGTNSESKPSEKIQELLAGANQLLIDARMEIEALSKETLSA